MADPKAAGPVWDFEAINRPEFLERLRKGGSDSQKAFTQLVRATNDKFHGFIRRQLPLQEECQEVLQEVYLAVHKGLAGFKGDCKLTTWMFSLAHHKICDCIGDRNRSGGELTERREATLSTENTGDGNLLVATAWDVPPDRLSARNAVEVLIGKAIEALPENARQVYHLRDVEGLSGEETATITGLSSENVRVQLHRARRKIVDWVRENMDVSKSAEVARASGAEGGGAQKLIFKVLYPCDKIRDFMYDYLDDRLPTVTSVRFHAHLKLCPECRRYLVHYRTAANAKAFRNENPPPAECEVHTLEFLNKTGIAGAEKQSY